MATNVDFETVKIACEELIRQGEKVTADKVLLKTKGSKSTIVKYLREWRNKVEEQQSLMAEELGFSPEFIQAFNRETYRYTTETKTRFTSLLEQSKDSESFATMALQEAESENADLNLQIESLRRLLKKSEEKNAGLEAEHKGTIEQLQKQLIEKDSEIKSLSDSKDKSLTTIAKYEIKIEDNDKIANNYTSEISKTKDDINSLRKELNNTVKNEVKLQAELNAAQEKITSIKEYNSQSITSSNEREENLKVKVELLQSNIESLNTNLSNTQESKAKSELELAVSKKENELIELQLLKITEKEKSHKN